MSDDNSYWAGRRDSAYLQAVHSICDTIAGRAETVLDVGSKGTPILEWRRSHARRLVSIDLREPYVADGVDSITDDFLAYPIAEPFDLVTCLQVLEHVPDAAAFARKLLAAGKVVVVSVPYKWPKGTCPYHIHDPVDEHLMQSWFGRLPTSQYVVREPTGECRMVQVFRTAAAPPPSAPATPATLTTRPTITVVHKARRATADWPLFSLVRNEATLLPYFFHHYRGLGIDHFFVYDDQSTDETPALLRAQPDCTVLTSPHRFGDVCGMSTSGVPKRFCSLLRETLPPAFARGRWAVVVDADELMILPPGIDTLPQMCRLLDARGQRYATAPMVDFYAETLATEPAAGASPFAACPYFDAGPLYEWDGSQITPRRFFRGVRARLHRFMAATHPWIMEDLYGSPQPAWMTKCWKVPLLKDGQGIARRGDHEISVPPATNCDVALAHFKFLAGLEGKVAAAVADAQYFGHSLEYRFLQAAIATIGHRSLLGPESRRFTGSESLVQSGLLQPIVKGP